MSRGKSYNLKPYKPIPFSWGDDPLKADDDKNKQPTYPNQLLSSTNENVEQNGKSYNLKPYKPHSFNWGDDYNKGPDVTLAPTNLPNNVWTNQEEISEDPHLHTQHLPPTNTNEQSTEAVNILTAIDTDNKDYIAESGSNIIKPSIDKDENLVDRPTTSIDFITENEEMRASLRNLQPYLSDKYSHFMTTMASVATTPRTTVKLTVESMMEDVFENINDPSWKDGNPEESPKKITVPDLSILLSSRMGLPATTITQIRDYEDATKHKVTDEFGDVDSVNLNNEATSVTPVGLVTAVVSEEVLDSDSVAKQGSTSTELSDFVDDNTEDYDDLENPDNTTNSDQYEYAPDQTTEFSASAADELDSVFEDAFDDLNKDEELGVFSADITNAPDDKEYDAGVEQITAKDNGTDSISNVEYHEEEEPTAIIIAIHTNQFDLTTLPPQVPTQSLLYSTPVDNSIEEIPANVPEDFKSEVPLVDQTTIYNQQEFVNTANYGATLGRDYNTAFVTGEMLNLNPTIGEFVGTILNGGLAATEAVLQVNEKESSVSAELLTDRINEAATLYEIHANVTASHDIPHEVPPTNMQEQITNASEDLHNKEDVLEMHVVSSNPFVANITMDDSAVPINELNTSDLKTIVEESNPSSTVKFELIPSSSSTVSSESIATTPDQHQFDLELSGNEDTKAPTDFHELPSEESTIESQLYRTENITNEESEKITSTDLPTKPTIYLNDYSDENILPKIESMLQIFSSTEASLVTLLKISTTDLDLHSTISGSINGSVPDKIMAPPHESTEHGEEASHNAEGILITQNHAMADEFTPVSFVDTNTSQSKELPIYTTEFKILSTGLQQLEGLVYNGTVVQTPVVESINNTEESVLKIESNEQSTTSRLLDLHEVLTPTQQTLINPDKNTNNPSISSEMIVDDHLISGVNETTKSAVVYADVSVPNLSASPAINLGTTGKLQETELTTCYTVHVSTDLKSDQMLNEGGGHLISSADHLQTNQQESVITTERGLQTISEEANNKVAEVNVTSGEHFGMTSWPFVEKTTLLNQHLLTNFHFNGYNETSTTLTHTEEIVNKTPGDLTITDFYNVPGFSTAGIVDGLITLTSPDEDLHHSIVTLETSTEEFEETVPETTMVYYSPRVSSGTNDEVTDVNANTEQTTKSALYSVAFVPFNKTGAKKTNTTEELEESTTDTEVTTCYTVNVTSDVESNQMLSESSGHLQPVEHGTTERGSHIFTDKQTISEEFAKINVTLRGQEEHVFSTSDLQTDLLPLSDLANFTSTTLSHTTTNGKKHYLIIDTTNEKTDEQLHINLIPSITLPPLLQFDTTISEEQHKFSTLREEHIEPTERGFHQITFSEGANLTTTTQPEHHGIVDAEERISTQFDALSTTEERVDILAFSTNDELVNFTVNTTVQEENVSTPIIVGLTNPSKEHGVTHLPPAEHITSDNQLEASTLKFNDQEGLRTNATRLGGGDAEEWITKPPHHAVSKTTPDGSFASDLMVHTSHTLDDQFTKLDFIALVSAATRTAKTKTKTDHENEGAQEDHEDLLSTVKQQTLNTSRQSSTVRFTGAADAATYKHKMHTSIADANTILGVDINVNIGHFAAHDKSTICPECDVEDEDMTGVFSFGSTESVNKTTTNAFKNATAEEAPSDNRTHFSSHTHSPPTTFHSEEQLHSSSLSTMSNFDRNSVRTTKVHITTAGKKVSGNFIQFDSQDESSPCEECTAETEINLTEASTDIVGGSDAHVHSTISHPKTSQREELLHSQPSTTELSVEELLVSTTAHETSHHEETIHSLPSTTELSVDELLVSTTTVHETSQHEETIHSPLATTELNAEELLIGTTTDHETSHHKELLISTITAEETSHHEEILHSLPSTTELNVQELLVSTTTVHETSQHEETIHSPLATTELTVEQLLIGTTTAHETSYHEELLASTMTAQETSNHEETLHSLPSTTELNAEELFIGTSTTHETSHHEELLVSTITAHETSQHEETLHSLPATTELNAEELLIGTTTTHETSHHEELLISHPSTTELNVEELLVGTTTTHETSHHEELLVSTITAHETSQHEETAHSPLATTELNVEQLLIESTTDHETSHHEELFVSTTTAHETSHHEEISHSHPSTTELNVETQETSHNEELLISTTTTQESSQHKETVHALPSTIELNVEEPLIGTTTTHQTSNHEELLHSHPLTTELTVEEPLIGTTIFQETFHHEELLVSTITAQGTFNHEETLHSLPSSTELNAEGLVSTITAQETSNHEETLHSLPYSTELNAEGLISTITAQETSHHEEILHSLPTTVELNVENSTSATHETSHYEELLYSHPSTTELNVEELLIGTTTTHETSHHEQLLVSTITAQETSHHEETLHSLPATTELNVEELLISTTTVQETSNHEELLISTTTDHETSHHKETLHFLPYTTELNVEELLVSTITAQETSHHEETLHSLPATTELNVEELLISTTTVQKTSNHEELLISTTTDHETSHHKETLHSLPYTTELNVEELLVSTTTAHETSHHEETIHSHLATTELNIEELLVSTTTAHETSHHEELLASTIIAEETSHHEETLHSPLLTTELSVEELLVSTTTAHETSHHEEILQSVVPTTELSFEETLHPTSLSGSEILHETVISTEAHIVTTEEDLSYNMHVSTHNESQGTEITESNKTEETNIDKSTANTLSEETLEQLSSNYSTTILSETLTSILETTESVQVNINVLNELDTTPLTLNKEETKATDSNLIYSSVSTLLGVENEITTSNNLPEVSETVEGTTNEKPTMETMLSHKSSSAHTPKIHLNTTISPELTLRTENTNNEEGDSFSSKSEYDHVSYHLYQQLLKQGSIKEHTTLNVAQQMITTSEKSSSVLSSSGPTSEEITTIENCAECTAVEVPSNQSSSTSHSEQISHWPAPERVSDHFSSTKPSANASNFDKTTLQHKLHTSSTTANTKNTIISNGTTIFNTTTSPMLDLTMPSIYINLPTHFPNSTEPIPNFENYYTSEEANLDLFDDEQNDTTIDTNMFRSMNLHDFDAITEYPVTPECITEQTTNATCLRVTAVLSDLNKKTKISNSNYDDMTSTEEFVKAAELSTIHQTEQEEKQSLTTLWPDDRTSTEVPNLSTSFDETTLGIETTTECTCSCKNKDLQDTKHQSSSTMEVTTPPINLEATLNGNNSDLITIKTNTENVHTIPSETTTFNNVAEAVIGEEIFATVTAVIATNEEINRPVIITTDVNSATFVETIEAENATVCVMQEVSSGGRKMNLEMQVVTSKSVDGNGSHCPLPDYNASKSCMCSIDAFLDDLKQKTTEREFTETIDKYLCNSFVPVNKGIKLGTHAAAEVPHARRVKRTVSMSDYLGIHKRDVIQNAEITHALENDFQIKNTDKQIFATPGSEVRISCAPPPLETTTGTWRFNGKSITEGKIVEGNGFITVDTIVPQDGGNYTCIDVHGLHHVHKLSVITLPFFIINASILYEVNDRCEEKSADLFQKYLSTDLSDILCGSEHKICNLVVHNTHCVHKGVKDYLDTSVELGMEPLGMIMPNLNKTDCDVTCQLKLYSKMVGILAKNMDIFQLQTVYFNASSQEGIVLRPTEAESNADNEGTAASKLIISCAPGFGLIPDSHICEACRPNTFSGGDEAFCTDCPPATYQPSVGSKSCLVCASIFDGLICARGIILSGGRFTYMIALAGSLMLLLFVGFGCALAKKGGSKDPTDCSQYKRRRKRRKIDQDVEKQEDQHGWFRNSRRRSLKENGGPELLHP